MERFPPCSLTPSTIHPSWVLANPLTFLLTPTPPVRRAARTGSPAMMEQRLRSSADLPTRQQLIQIVVDARYCEIRLPLERMADVSRCARRIAIYLDNGEQEFVGLVEAGENLVLGHGDGLGAGSAPLHLDEP